LWGKPGALVWQLLATAGTLGRSLWILIVIMAANLSAGGKNVCPQALAKNFARHVPESFFVIFSYGRAVGQLRRGLRFALFGNGSGQIGQQNQSIQQRQKKPGRRAPQTVPWRAHLACKVK